MNECLNSGMNKTEWCRANGISDKQFFFTGKRILRKRSFCCFDIKRTFRLSQTRQMKPAHKKISFAEISIPIKQEESVRNGFHPDIILRKGPVSVEISNSVSAELLSRIGDIFHALNDASGFTGICLATGYTDLRRGMEGLHPLSSSIFSWILISKRYSVLFCGRRANTSKRL